MAANKYIDLLALFLFFCTVVSTDRRITTDFSLGCNGRQDCEGVVAYIKALGDKDTLHYLISSIGLPSALVIRTESSTMNKDEIMIDWESFLSENITDKAGSIKVDKSIKVLFSYGVFFTRLFQYNDTSDTADVSQYNVNNTDFHIFKFDHFTWENLKKVSDDFEIVLKALDSGKQDMQKIVNGSLNFKFHFFGTQGRASDLPHLEYNEDTTQFDFILSNINTHNATLARFAIEAVMVSSDNKGSMDIDQTKSLDDEYTPGVFKLNNWRTRPNDESNGGYIQWKPVCYLAEPRSRDSDTYVKHYSVNKVNSELKDMLKQSIAYAYFGEALNSSLMTATNFSFGLKKDGTFTGSNYTAWTGSIGYGTPPIDKVSTLVIVVISVGLGIPVIIILCGGLFVFFKKRSEKNKGYEQLNGVASDSPFQN